MIRALSSNVLFSALGLTVLATPTAAAQDDPVAAAVLPPRVEAGVDARHGEAAATAVVRALRGRGFRVTEPAEARRRLGRRPECEELSYCARDARAALDADLVVTVGVFGDPGEPPALMLMAFGRDEQHEARASAPLTGGKAAEAAAGLVPELLEAFEAGRPVAVEVDGPEGAFLTVDGRPVGALPWRGTLLPGRHRLVAGVHGRDPWVHELSLEPGTTERVALRAEPGRARAPAAPGNGEPATGPAPSGPARVEPSAWNLIGGALVAGAGVALAVPPLYTWVHDGECVDPAPGGGCRTGPGGAYETYDLGLQSGLMAGLAAVLVGVGVWWMVAQPIQVEVQPDALGGGRVVLRGEL